MSNDEEEDENQLREPLYQPSTFSLAGGTVSVHHAISSVENAEELAAKCLQRSRNVRASWPDDVQVIMPPEDDEQMLLLPDSAECMASVVLLRMCFLPFEPFHVPEAELMSASGRLPVLRSGTVGFLASGYQGAAVVVETTGSYSGPSDTEELHHVAALVEGAELAEFIVCWGHAETRTDFSERVIHTRYSAELGRYACWRQRRLAVTTVRGARRLATAYRALDACCRSLAERLVAGELRVPGPAAALVYGHLRLLVLGSGRNLPLGRPPLGAVPCRYPALLALLQDVHREFGGAHPDFTPSLVDCDQAELRRLLEETDESSLQPDLSLDWIERDEHWDGCSEPPCFEDDAPPDIEIDKIDEEFRPINL